MSDNIVDYFKIFSLLLLVGVLVVLFRIIMFRFKKAENVLLNIKTKLFCGLKIFISSKRFWIVCLIVFYAFNNRYSYSTIDCGNNDPKLNVPIRFDRWTGKVEMYFAFGDHPKNKEEADKLKPEWTDVARMERWVMSPVKQNKK